MVYEGTKIYMTPKHNIKVKASTEVKNFFDIFQKYNYVANLYRYMFSPELPLSVMNTVASPCKL